MKKLSIIGTVGIPAKYGGFEIFTEYFTKYLNDKFQITVFCSSKEYTNKMKYYNNSRLIYIPLKANGIQSIPYDIISIFIAAFTSDILLVLGVSGCIILPIIKFFFRKRKVCTNIDGLEWKRDKWGKFAKWFLKFSEKCAVKYSDEIVSDNIVIQKYIKDEYNVSSSMIEYGADHVKKEPITDNDCKEYPFLNNKYAFSVCRIEPENNIDKILTAFNSFNTLPLVIVGNWEASDYGKELKQEFFCDNTILLDPIYDQERLNKIRSNCYIYIHGHSAGGTNPSLIEAMYLKLPIVAYSVNFNKETTENQALYFGSSKDLVCTLESLNDNEQSKIGKNMQDIAERRYKWDIIAQKYYNLFI